MKTRRVVLAGIALAVLLAAAAPFASSAPDGLTQVAASQGIAAAPTPAWRHAAMPDYALPGVAHAGLANAAAAVIGTLAVCGLAWLGGRLLLRPRRRGTAA